jgi:hypothetical protein
MKGHEFEVSDFGESAVCTKCGVVARVELQPSGGLRSIAAWIFVRNAKGLRVAPSRVKCRPRKK